MRGMILAAGRGRRMGELTRHVPKPLLQVGNRYLIEYALNNFVRAGIKEVVINVYYHAEQIKQAIGDGKRYGLDIVYSVEAERLETGGGIVNALPLLGDSPFLVMSSDIICHYSLGILPKEPKGLAHLVMVDNPYFKPQGDFGLSSGFADMGAKPTYTFANIGVFKPAFFANAKAMFFPLSDLLLPAIHQGLVTAEYYQKLWFNIGTPEDLKICHHLFRE